MTQYRIKKCGPRSYEVQKKVLWYWENVVLSYGYDGSAYGNTFTDYHSATLYLDRLLEKKNEWKNVPKYFYPPFPDKEPE